MYIVKMFQLLFSFLCCGQWYISMFTWLSYNI